MQFVRTVRIRQVANRLTSRTNGTIRRTVGISGQQASAIGDHLLRLCLYGLIRIVTRFYGQYKFDGSWSCFTIRIMSKVLDMYGSFWDCPFKCNVRNCDVNLPRQAVPLPAYPLWQVHMNDPSVFVQSAFEWQLPVDKEHSLTSRD